MATRASEQLIVTAHLRGGFVSRHPPQLDALLEWVAAERSGYRYPPAAGGDARSFDIPIADSHCGRYRLCSSAQFSAEEHEVHHKHRRAPWVEFARLGSNKIRRVNISLGENKSYRVPFVETHVAGDLLRWFCVGDASGIQSMLAEVRYIGRFRGAGQGRIVRWTVERAEPWPGFPVLRDGEPLRPLPEDVAPDAMAPRGFAALRPPYWDHAREEPCLLPELF